MHKTMNKTGPDKAISTLGGIKAPPPRELIILPTKLNSGYATTLHSRQRTSWAKQFLFLRLFTTTRCDLHLSGPQNLGFGFQNTIIHFEIPTSFLVAV